MDLGLQVLGYDVRKMIACDGSTDSGYQICAVKDGWGGDPDAR